MKIPQLPKTLQTVAAYIDLNPLPAVWGRIPSEYRWRGYAEAMAGLAEARACLAAAVFASNQELDSRRKVFG